MDMYTREVGGYADGTEGHSGTGTSRERAEHERDSGEASIRQRMILARLAEVGSVGLTWKEVADGLRTHHGSASSSLTNLHKAGWIVRTNRKRGRSKVYVLPQHVLPTDRLEQYVPRAQQDHDKIADLEDRIAQARTAVLTGESSTRVLRILEGRA